jgi:polar amino acid transport system permease protein
VQSTFHYLTMPFLLHGTWLAIQIAAVALVGGLLLGLVLALMRQSSIKIISLTASTYIWFIRGTPLLLQLVFLYDALPAWGIVLTPMITAFVGFVINEAAYAAEIIRGGIISVNRSQTLAAASLGMGRWLTAYRIVLPQALRAILPPMGNQAISLLKNSSLASVISVNELTLRSEQIVASNFQFFPVFIAAGIQYLIMTTIISVAQVYLERHFDLERDRITAEPTAFGRFRGWAKRAIGLIDFAPIGHGDDKAADERAEMRVSARGLFPAPQKTEAASRESEKRAQVSVPFVELRDIWKSYSRRDILRGINLTAKPGEVITIMGPSGSGKSTLLRMVNHLEHVDRGEILVGGRHVGYDSIGGTLRPHRNVAKARAEARIGMVFQSLNLFDHLTALENVIEAPIRVYGESYSTALNRANSLLSAVGLAKHRHRLPHRLSGGQQQRVAIARALAISPQLMLFDEPTSALDPELVGEVLRVMRGLADEGMTMLIVTHEVAFARQVADRIVVLDEGKIIEEGGAADILDNPREARTRQFLRRVARAEDTF